MIMHVSYNQAEHRRAVRAYRDELKADNTLFWLKVVRFLAFVVTFGSIGLFFLMTLPVWVFLFVAIVLWVVVDGLIAKRKRLIKDQYLLL